MNNDERDFKRIKYELERCQSDTGYFRLGYLPVVDRDSGRKVAFRLKEAQKIVLEQVTRYRETVVIKPRRTGITRAIFSRIYGKCRWTPNLPAISVFHNDEDAVKAFEQIRDWERGLPEWMRQGPFALQSDREQMLRWKHGGVIAVVTAGSKPAGSFTWWYRHYSEFAKYKDPETVVRVIEGGVAPEGRAIYETTSEGAGAGAHLMWKNDNGMGKVFFPWFIDVGYQCREDKVPYPHTIESLLTADVCEYGKEFNLSVPRLLWVALQLRKFHYNPAEGDASAAWLSFHREFPATPELAFRSARGRVFKPHFPWAKEQRGYRRYRERQPYRVYSMGLDAAGGGEDGDFSAFTVLDVTVPEKPVVVATFYDKLSVPEFVPWVLRELDYWQDVMFVCERDGWARAVQDAVLESGHKYVWVEIFTDKLTKQRAERFGRTAGDLANKELVVLLQEFINPMTIDLSDDIRIQYEINDFVWNDRGKAEAQAPNHDDIVRSLGLALLGREQIQLTMDHVRTRRPVTLQEKVVAQMRSTNEEPLVYDDDPWGGGVGDGPLTSVWDME